MTNERQASGAGAALEHGQPDKPVHPGETWHVSPSAVHEVKVGDQTTKVLAVYVVERGKPLATPWTPNTTINQ